MEKPCWRAGALGVIDSMPNYADMVWIGWAVLMIVVCGVSLTTKTVGFVAQEGLIPLSSAFPILSIFWDTVGLVAFAWRRPRYFCFACVKVGMHCRRLGQLPVSQVADICFRPLLLKWPSSQRSWYLGCCQNGRGWGSRQQVECGMHCS